MGKRERRPCFPGHHSQGHALWVGEWPARACRSCWCFAGLRPVAGKMPALPGGPRLRGRTSLPGPCLGWGSGRLGRVVLVGALRAFGPLRARCPRSQGGRAYGGGHRSQGRASGGGVAGSGVSFLLVLCGPSARCGQDARAPRGAALTGEDIAPRAVPRAGEWPARVCRSCQRFAGLRPVAGKMPALPGGPALPGDPITPITTPRAGEWSARACRSCWCFAGLRPVAGKMPALPGGPRLRGRTSLPGGAALSGHHSQGHALGGGVERA